MTVSQWLFTHTAPEEVVFAVQGQPIHYLLQRPVVSVINPSYTARKDDDLSFRKLMNTFQARYLIVFPSEKMKGPRAGQEPFSKPISVEQRKDPPG